MQELVGAGADPKVLHPITGKTAFDVAGALPPHIAPVALAAPRKRSGDMIAM